MVWKEKINYYQQRVISQKHPMRFLFSRILWKTGLSSWFLIRRENHLLRFYPSSVSATLWVDAADLQESEAFLKSYLRRGDVMLDVGANIGQLSLLASTLVGNTGKVIAIEAHPKIFGYLKGNIALNQRQNIDTYNVAIGSEEGSIFFSDLKSDDQNAVITNTPGMGIPLRRLDDLPIPGISIDLLKIDVEGYEKFVLEGAAATLRKTKCIYFESWAKHFARYDYTCGDLYTLLAGKGFQIFKLRGLQFSPISANYISEQCENLVALRDVDEFRLRTGAQILQ